MRTICLLGIYVYYVLFLVYAYKSRQLEAQQDTMLNFNVLSTS